MHYSDHLEIINFLEQEHALLRQFIFLIETGNGFGQELEELATQLSQHHELEEEALFIHLAEDKNFQIEAFAFLERHELVRESLFKIRRSVNEEQRRSRLLVLCDLLRLCLEREESVIFPFLRTSLSQEKRIELGLRYRELKVGVSLAMDLPRGRASSLAEQEGRASLLILWLLGVPLWILLLVLLVRG